VRLDDATGVVVVSQGPSKLLVDVSLTLVPVLMPLLARLRQVLDLDAEPAQIDLLLAARGLGAQVARHPGVRVPGAFDGFALACRLLFQRAAGDAGRALAASVATALGDPVATGIPGLTTLGATAARIAQAGATRLTALGVPSVAAGVIAAVARAVVERRLVLAPGSDVKAAQCVLATLGVDEDTTETLIMRALHWPDAFCAASLGAQREPGVAGTAALRAAAEPWRPWRAYAAIHLWLDHARPARA
jgi:AraC family transcriptional regulator of adaptative response / DNA-3-methyladenine glycosylase II